LSIVCAFTFSSCEKIKEKVFESFTATGADFKFTIPVITSTSTETAIGTTNLNFNLDSTIKAATGGIFGVDILKQVNPEEITLTLLNPDQANNLANFESLNVKISAQGSGNPTFIASMANPDTYAETVNLTVDKSKQLLNFLKSSSITYEVTGKARRATTKQLNAQLVVKLKFK
jgi:hypothetical protein